MRRLRLSKNQVDFARRLRYIFTARRRVANNTRRLGGTRSSITLSLSGSFTARQPVLSGVLPNTSDVIRRRSIQARTGTRTALRPEGARDAGRVPRQESSPRPGGESAQGVDGTTAARGCGLGCARGVDVARLPELALVQGRTRVVVREAGRGRHLTQRTHRGCADLAHSRPKLARCVSRFTRPGATRLSVFCP